MKDLGEANFVLCIQLFRDRKNRIIALSQSSYIENVLKKFVMQDSKKGGQPSRTRITLSLDDYPKTSKEKVYMEKVPNASAMGSPMCAMFCMIPDICYAVGIVSRY